MAEAGGLYFGRPAHEEQANAQAQQDEDAERQCVAAQLKEAKQKAKRAKQKFDPAQLAFARELKDRWLETVAAKPELLAAPAPEARYDVRRLVAENAAVFGAEKPESGPERLAA